MKKTNFCGIFATVFVVATVIILASCSQDDEYYEDGLFTRADEMMTRSGEQGGGTLPSDSDTIVKPEEGFIPVHSFIYHEFEEEEVDCYSHAAGYTFVGKVYVSGIIYKDSIADYYWWEITDANTEMTIVGGPSVDMMNVTAHSAAINVNFVIKGLSFYGQKIISYPPLP